MARPVCCRRIGMEPGVRYFKPRGIPLTELEEVVLGLDEMEAIRLADLEGLYQEQAAERMEISRQTFGRIIELAHRKISDALVNGKALKIEGGEVKMAGMKKFECSDCGHKWELGQGTVRPGQCPNCQGSNLHRSPEDRGFARSRGPGRGPGRGQCQRSGAGKCGPGRGRGRNSI